MRVGLARIRIRRSGSRSDGSLEGGVEEVKNKPSQRVMDPVITGWNYASRDLEVIVIARGGINNINKLNILPRYGRSTLI